MAVNGLSADLDWWRGHRPSADPAAMRELLGRLQAWKTEHDADRGRQFGFLRMAWDGVFADEDEKVCGAIAELEAALAAQNGSKQS